MSGMSGPSKQHLPKNDSLFLSLSYIYLHAKNQNDVLISLPNIAKQRILQFNWLRTFLTEVTFTKDSRTT